MAESQHLVQNPLGYWEVSPKPDMETLRRFYGDQYFGASDQRNQYAYGYTKDELEHKLVDAAEAMHVLRRAPGTMLEVGVGEGFFLDYMARHGWDVKGIDFTSDGIGAFFPHLLDRVKIGDAFALLDAEIHSGGAYDFVVCNNVLEHVIDPSTLLDLLARLLKPDGSVRLVVPNDFSWLQELAVIGRGIPDRFWVCPPAHLNYFNTESIVRFMRSKGWAITEMLSGFPIDLFLLNPDTDYVTERQRGRACHFARVAFELGLWRRGIDSVVEFRRGCAAAGVGRDIAVYGRPPAL